MRTTLLCTLFFLAISNATAAAQMLELTLEVGEQRVISSERVSSYSEGISGIVDVRLTKDGSSFVIVGERPGRTSLLFMLSDGRQLQYKIIVTDAGGTTTATTQSNVPSTAVQARDNVRLDFYFVQLSQDDHLHAGLSWPGMLGPASMSAQLNLMSGSFSDATAVVTDQALPHLDMAQACGYAKLLRQAAVITANGSEANFSGGGELNIAVQTALSVGMRQIAFGSQIKVLPRYDHDSGRIELVIHAEVSDLTTDHGSGIPGRVLSSLDSIVNLELGQSVVLAGLTARSESSTKEGLPGLSQLPIIGPLFGSREHRNEHSENLIVIMPSVVDAVSLDARERVRDALELFKTYEGDLDDTPLRKIDPQASAKKAHGAKP